MVDIKSLIDSKKGNTIPQNESYTPTVEEAEQMFEEIDEQAVFDDEDYDSEVTEEDNSPVTPEPIRVSQGVVQDNETMFFFDDGRYCNKTTGGMIHCYREKNDSTKRGKPVSDGLLNKTGVTFQKGNQGLIKVSTEVQANKLKDAYNKGYFGISENLNLYVFKYKIEEGFKQSQKKEDEQFQKEAYDKEKVQVVCNYSGVKIDGLHVNQLKPYWVDHRKTTDTEYCFCLKSDDYIDTEGNRKPIDYKFVVLLNMGFIQYDESKGVFEAINTEKRAEESEKAAIFNTSAQAKATPKATPEKVDRVFGTTSDPNVTKYVHKGSEEAIKLHEKAEKIGKVVPIDRDGYAEQVNAVHNGTATKRKPDTYYVSSEDVTIDGKKKKIETIEHTVKGIFNKNYTKRDNFAELAGIYGNAVEEELLPIKTIHIVNDKAIINGVNFKPSLDTDDYEYIPVVEARALQRGDTYNLFYAGFAYFQRESVFTLHTLSFDDSRQAFEILQTISRKLDIPEYFRQFPNLKTLTIEGEVLKREDLYNTESSKVKEKFKKERKSWHLLEGFLGKKTPKTAKRVPTSSRASGIFGWQIYEGGGRQMTDDIQGFFLNKMKENAHSDKGIIRKTLGFGVNAVGWIGSLGANLLTHIAGAGLDKFHDYKAQAETE